MERRTIPHHRYKQVQNLIAHSMCHDHHMYCHCNHLEIGEEILSLWACSFWGTRTCVLNYGYHFIHPLIDIDNRMVFESENSSHYYPWWTDLPTSEWGNCARFCNEANFGSMITYTKLVKQGRKTLLHFSHNGQILVGRLRESHESRVRVGKSDDGPYHVHSPRS